MPTAPAASRANKKAHEQVTTGLASNAGFPRANGFNGFLRALPGDRALLSPSPRNAKHCRELTSASRGQDHTTSPSASHALRLGAQEASIAARTNVRDDREAPLLEERGPAETSGGDLPDDTSGFFSTLRHAGAANWHDGQIT
jgi:hypothetical protein